VHTGRMPGSSRTRRRAALLAAACCIASTASAQDLVTLEVVQGICDKEGSCCITSPLAGQTVLVHGTVIGAVSGGFFIQDESEYGVYVYDSTFAPAVGDSVSLEGVISEYHDLTELSHVTNPSITSSGNPLPAPLTLATGDLGERHE
jgi:predicted extracellular nuclease